MKMTSYKKCAVPMCKSTTIKYPDKLFIHVPKMCPKRRKQWLQLARRELNCTSDKSAIHFCEDHFDLPNDMENYIQYSLMGSVGKIRMKPDCLPSKFECQSDVKRTATPQPRSAINNDTENLIKRRRVGGRLKLKPDVCPHKFDCEKSMKPTKKREAYKKSCQNEFFENSLSKEVPSAASSPPSSFNDEVTDSNSDDDDIEHVAFSGDTSSCRPATDDETETKAFECKDCGLIQNEFRYVCLQCEDRELCAACQGSGAHAAHYVLRVPRSRTQEEIMLVLDRVREIITSATYYDECEVYVKVEELGPADDPFADPEKMNDNIQPLSPKLDFKMKFEEEMHDDTNHIFTDFSIENANEPSDNVTQADMSKTQNGKTEISDSKRRNTQTKIKTCKTQKSRIPMTRRKERLIQTNANTQDLQQSGCTSLGQGNTAAQLSRVTQFSRVQCESSADHQSSTTVQKTQSNIETDCSNFKVMTHHTKKAQVVREHNYCASQIGNSSGPARKRKR